MNNPIMILIGFVYNLLVALILIRLIYYPKSTVQSHVFTFLAFNTVIFFVINFLSSTEMGIGMGFGLFAVFSLLRYRTDPLPIREMTYLFIIVALPIMNATGIADNNWAGMIIADGLILLTIWILEKGWGFHYEISKTIIYEKIDLIVPEKYDELKADLEKRTGVKINKIVIGKIDFMRDIAYLEVFSDQDPKYNWNRRMEAVTASDTDDDL